MSQFYTVTEAARLTGKSPSSIRRIIHPIRDDDQHPNRVHIQPSVADAQALRIKGENFAWRISEELLAREVPAETAAEKGTDTPAIGALHEGHAELLSMLRRELDIKNQQITQQAAMLSQQMELISSLSERLREGNVLIGSLQQRLALPEVSTWKKPSVVDADSGKPGSRQPAAKSAPKPPKVEKPKRGFFARMFH